MIIEKRETPGFTFINFLINKKDEKIVHVFNTIFKVIITYSSKTCLCRCGCNTDECFNCDVTKSFCNIIAQLSSV